MCDSDDLKSFLIDADHAFEERKRQTQPQIDAEFADESQTYSSMAYNTISSVLSIATEKLGSIISAASSNA